MDDKTIYKTHETLAVDEKELSDFVVKGGFALIAASWVLFQYSGKHPLLVLSMLCAVVSILLIGIKWAFRISHYHKILDDIRDEKADYGDFDYRHTCWGKWNQKIHYAVFVVILLAVLLFIIGSIASLS